MRRGNRPEPLRGSELQGYLRTLQVPTVIGGGPRLLPPSHRQTLTILEKDLGYSFLAMEQHAMPRTANVTASFAALTPFLAGFEDHELAHLAKIVGVAEERNRDKGSELAPIKAVLTTIIDQRDAAVPGQRECRDLIRLCHTTGMVNAPDHFERIAETTARLAPHAPALSEVLRAELHAAVNDLGRRATPETRDAVEAIIEPIVPHLRA